MARRIFVILAFVLALELGIPVVNAMSPFTTRYSTNSTAFSDSNFNVNNIASQSGCSQSSGGSYTCGASISGGGAGNIFGSVVNTIMVFGNFFAAAGFLGQIAGGVFLVSSFVATWLGGPNLPEGLALLVLAIQGLVWFAYADGIFYIISGRDLLG